MPDYADIEQRLRQVGQSLLTAAQTSADSGRRRYEDTFLNQLLDHAELRRRLLHFVDVLPALNHDADVAEHLDLYLGERILPLPWPRLVQWGLHHARRGVPAHLVAATARAMTRRLARRFIVGETLAQALPRLHALRRQGLDFSLDVLGEATTGESQAAFYQRQYLELIDRLAEEFGADAPTSAGAGDPGPDRAENTGRIDSPASQDHRVCLSRHAACHGDAASPATRLSLISPRRVASGDFPPSDFGARPRPGLSPAQLSLKVSSLYCPSGAADIDGAVAAIKNRLRPIFEAARKKHILVTLDMEQFDTRGVITRVFRELLTEKSLADWSGAGLAVQAYLRDAVGQLETLVAWARNRAAPVTVRLVRGAYWDYERLLAWRNNWSPPVWERKAETDACYEACLRMLLQAFPVVRTAVATHNPRSIALAAALAEDARLRNGQYEFQMLYGMNAAFQQALRQLHLPLRVYVPFGALLPGMAYLVRRLLENSSQASLLRQGLLTSPGVERLLERPTISANRAPTPRPATFTNEAPRRFSVPAEFTAFSAALRRVQASLPAVTRLWINNRSLPRDPPVTSVNPSHPSQTVGQVSPALAADVAEAVNAAKAAFEKWAHGSARWRGDYLRRAAAWLRQHRDQAAAWEILEAGKPWPQADADITEALDFLEYYAAQAERRLAPIHLPDPAAAVGAMGEENLYGFHPRGVAAIIAPWNFPLAIVTGMTAAALAAGNTVVIKPAPQTPVTASLLVQAFEQADLPGGVVNFLPGGDSIGRLLVEHPQVDVVAFTGSEAAGREICAAAARVRPGQNQIKRVIVEMGGKNAIIVDDDADLDEAIPGVVTSAFGYAGQKCSACSRVIVVGRIYRDFMDRLIDATASLKVGPAEDPATFVGPVIDEEAARRITAVIEKGRQEAKLVFQAPLPPQLDGYFVPPTIFTDVAPRSALAQEEIFGPVLVVLAAKDFTEALRLANAVRFGLTGGVYSRNPAHLAQAREDFTVGNLYFNRAITGAVVGRQPFGGLKLSGSGAAAGGPDYLLEFVLPHTITENTVRHSFVPEASANQLAP